MSVRSTLLSTLLIGLLAGAGILQLLDGTNDASEPVAVQVAPAPTNDPATVPARESPPTTATSADPSNAIEFLTRSELEEVLPRSIVNVLLDHNALLIEKVETNAP